MKYKINDLSGCEWLKDCEPLTRQEIINMFRQFSLNDCDNYEPSKAYTKRDLSLNFIAYCWNLEFIKEAIK